MERDEVRLAEERFLIDQLDAQLATALLAQVGVADEEVEPKRLQLPVDVAANAPAPEDAKRASRHAVHRDHIGEVPLATRRGLFQHLAAGGDPTRAGKDQGNRLLGHLLCAVVRNIAEGDSLLRQRGHIHIVVADAVPDHEPALLPRGDHLPRDLHHIHDDHVGIARGLDHLIGRRKLELVVGEGETALGELLLLPLQIRLDVVRNDNLHAHRNSDPGGCDHGRQAPLTPRKAARHGHFRPIGRSLPPLPARACHPAR